MPPPTSPVATPRLTARTVGLMKMYCQPSLQLVDGGRQSKRLPPDASEPAGDGGMERRHSMAAENTNVSGLDEEGQRRLVEVGEERHRRAGQHGRDAGQRGEEDLGHGGRAVAGGQVQRVGRGEVVVGDERGGDGLLGRRPQQGEDLEQEAGHDEAGEAVDERAGSRAPRPGPGRRRSSAGDDRTGRPARRPAGRRRSRAAAARTRPARWRRPPRSGSSR